jgi:hypothetical protein
MIFMANKIETGKLVLSSNSLSMQIRKIKTTIYESKQLTRSIFITSFLLEIPKISFLCPSENVFCTQRALRGVV